MKSAFISFLFLLPHFCNAQYTKCVTANKYLYSEDDKHGDNVTKWINKPITFCWNDGAFAFRVNGVETVMSIDKKRTEVSEARPPYFQTEFSALSNKNDPFPSYIVTITYSKPAEIAINYTQFGGYSYDFFTNDPDLPEMKRVLANTPKINQIKYKKITYPKNLRYPANNDSLNAGLRSDAICAVCIKDYLKKCIPYMNASLGEISLMFNVLPNGKIKWERGGYDTSIPGPDAQKIDNALKSAMQDMPLWKVPAGSVDPVSSEIDITFD